MEEKLLRALLLVAKILAMLITIVLLIYAFGEISYIIVPMILVAALFIYILYDINRKKTPMKKVPDWDTYVREHDDSHVRKFYQRDTREIHNRSGRQKHREAKGRNRHR